MHLFFSRVNIDFGRFRNYKKKLFSKQSWAFMSTGAALCTHFGGESVYMPKYAFERFVFFPFK